MFDHFSFSIGDPDDSARVTCFTLSVDSSQLVVAYTNGIVKQFQLHGDSATIMCQFRSTHSGPILVCRLSTDDRQLFTGSADCTVKVWSISDRSCLNTLKGPSVVSAMCLVGEATLVVGYVEGQVLIHDLRQRYSTAKELNQHSR